MEVVLRPSDPVGSKWHATDGETRLINAAIMRAKLVSGCTQMTALTIRFTTYHPGNRPVMSWHVDFEEDERPYSCVLRIFLSSPGNVGAKLPGVPIAAIRNDGEDVALGIFG